MAKNENELPETNAVHDADDGHEQHSCKLHDPHGPHNWTPEEDNQIDWYCPGRGEDKFNRAV